MARVNVEQKAFTDPRFALLGKLIGRDRWSAIGRMAAVWNACTERGAYALPVDIVNALFEDVDNFAGAIIRSELGEAGDDGATVRIRGTEDRIEWLSKKRAQARENGAKGGRPKTKTNDGTNVGSEKNQRGLQHDALRETPPALGSLLPAPATTTPREATPLPPADAGGRKRSKKREHRLFDVESDPYRLSNLLCSLIHQRDAKAKFDVQANAEGIDGLLRLDERTPEEVERVIRWCQADSFEQVNVLSAGALRRRFSALLQKSSNGTAKGRGGPSTPKFGANHFGEQQL